MANEQNEATKILAEFTETVQWLSQLSETEARAQHCLSLINSYVDLLDYTKVVAEQYEISTKTLELALEEIHRLKLELVKVVADKATKVPVDYRNRIEQ